MAGPPNVFERRWAAVLGSFAADRPLWAATFEIYPQIERVPELREMVAAAYERMRAELAAEFHHIDAAADENKAQVVGAFYLAIMIGVLAMRLVDPDHGPSARDLAEALRTIAADIAGWAARRDRTARRGSPLQAAPRRPDRTARREQTGQER